MSALIPALIEAIWGPAPLGKLIGRMRGEGSGGAPAGGPGGYVKAKSLIKPDNTPGAHPQVLQGLMTPYQPTPVTPGVYGPRQPKGR